MHGRRTSAAFSTVSAWCFVCNGTFVRKFLFGRDWPGANGREASPLGGRTRRGAEIEEGGGEEPEAFPLVPFPTLNGSLPLCVV